MSHKVFSFLLFFFPMYSSTFSDYCFCISSFFFPSMFSIYLPSSLLSLIFFSCSSFVLFHIYLPSLFLRPRTTPSRDSPSLFRHSTALPRSSILSFVFLAASLSASRTLRPLSPFSPSLISLRTSGMRGLFIQEWSLRRRCSA